VTQKDPLALAVFGAALALLAGLLLYVFFFVTPEPATPDRAFDFLRERIREMPAARPQPPASAPIPSPGIEAGHTWRYAVVVEPPIWRDITLTYRTQREGASVGVLTDFRYAGGKMNFHLGTFAPNHPSHENTRFPGFFMYAAYLKQPLSVGQQVAFGWHWQGKSAASIKRFEGQVTGWEDLQLPGGNLNTARIEGALSYLEDRQLRGRARETFWYAPKVAQIVKIVREGVSPDEASRHIVAELAEYR
jgi:hypothetical protein